MPYTPPALNAVNFELKTYTVPTLNLVDFEFEPTAPPAAGTTVIIMVVGL